MLEMNGSSYFLGSGQATIPLPGGGQVVVTGGTGYPPGYYPGQQGQPYPYPQNNTLMWLLLAGVLAAVLLLR